MSRDAIRPTLDRAAGALSTLLALDVLRLCSSALNSPFLVFDDNYCFLALSASVWTMGKMRDGAQWLSNHYAANDYYCEGEKVVGTWVGKGAEISGIPPKIAMIESDFCADVLAKNYVMRSLRTLRRRVDDGKDARRRSVALVLWLIEC